MTDSSSEEVLGALVSITQERDQESLEFALLQTIGKLLGCTTLKFFRLTPAHHAKTLLKTAELTRQQNYEENIFHYQVVKLSDDALQALKKHKIVQRRAQPLTQTYIPILAKSKAIGLLEISSLQPLSRKDERFINSLMQIYPNFLSVVRDNEADSLTGLLNRKTFDDKITRIFHSKSPKYDSLKREGVERREEQPGSHWLGVIDIDYFKKINDSYGHLYGDEVLILVSNLMRENFRENDLLYRYGGEEFVVVLSPCSPEEAISAFERFRENVEKYHFPQIGKVTVSIGFVKFADQDFPTTIVGHADQALYHAKTHGRNQTCSYEHLCTTGEIKVPMSTPVNDIEIF